MESPLLRLYGDLWSAVTDLLDLVSTKRLIMTGSKQLSANLTRNVRNTYFRDSGPVFDFNDILRSCQGLQSLESLAILPNSRPTLVRMPVSLDNFPSKLRSLSLDFATVAYVFSGFDFVTRTPNLVDLSLVGITKEAVPLEAFLLPSKLERLVLGFRGGQLSMGPADVARLPRSLIQLEINVAWRDTERFEKYEWPLSLTSLRMSSWSSRLKVEYLPRTLTSLDLSLFDGLESSFPREAMFPWRVFFPRLSYLLVSYFSRLYDTDLLLRSIVAPNAFEQEEAAAFISSGFWNIESLANASLTSYPSFTTLGLPSAWRSLETDEIIAHLDAVAPFIRNTNILQCSTDRPILKHAGATSAAEVWLDTNEDEDKFPSTLTSFTGRKVHVSLLPPTLTTLKCDTLIGRDTGDLTVIHSDDLPKVTTLHIYESVPTATISILPTLITDLHIVIGAPADWDLVATRLVSLRELKITLDAHWSCNVPLAPIQSTYLYSFDIAIHYALVMDSSKPRLAEFFATPSPLPSTVTELSIGGQPIHASIFPMLPRELETLYIVGFAWTDLTNQISLPYPEGANLSPEDLIKSLPPRLRSLQLNKGSDHGQKPISVDCLRFLPPSLGSFACYETFTLSEGEKSNIASILPPFLTSISFPGCSITYNRISGTERS